MKASRIMTRNVVTVSADATVRQAIAVLSEHAITSLPVLDNDRRIIGIVSEVDLLSARMPHDPTASITVRADGPDPAALVRDVMTEPVVCLSENADTADLAQVLVNNRVRAVPILAGTELVGIVSRRDVLRTLLRDDTAIGADVRQRLNEYSASSDQWTVEVAEGVVNVRGRFDNRRQQKTLAALLHTIDGVVRVHTG
jgi:CBS-domain-containing membrane protein